MYNLFTIYYFLDQRHHDLAQYLIIQEVFAFEENHLGLSVVSEEVGLTVDKLVLDAEEPPHHCLFIFCNALEAVLLDLLEGLNHGFVNLELRCTVLPLIAELTPAQAAEGQQTGHVEGRVDEYPLYAPQLFRIHCPHAGGDDEVWLLLSHENFKESYCLERIDWYVRANHLHPFRIEMVTHLSGRARTACRSKAVDIDYLFHGCKITNKRAKYKRKT